MQNELNLTTEVENSVTDLGPCRVHEAEEGFLMDEIISAIISSTDKACQEARKTGLPLLFAESGKLFKELPGGEIHFVKELPTLAKHGVEITRGNSVADK